MRSMRFIVDDYDVLCRSHFFEYLAHVSVVALRAALVHAALPADLLVALPIELGPIADKRSAGLPVAELVFKGRRDYVKDSVVIAAVPGTRTRNLFLTVSPGAINRMFFEKCWSRGCKQESIGPYLLLELSGSSLARTTNKK